jgi:large subunit ribosomal protein L21
MEKYAIIKIGPFQYTVEEGRFYEVPRFLGDEGKKFEEIEVLAVANGEDIKVGKPIVEGAKVSVTILEQGTGEKIVKNVYKSKSRYHKKTGHRKLVTRFKVDSIKLGAK